MYLSLSLDVRRIEMPLATMKHGNWTQQDVWKWRVSVTTRHFDSRNEVKLVLCILSITQCTHIHKYIHQQKNSSNVEHEKAHTQTLRTLFYDWGRGTPKWSPTLWRNSWILASSLYSGTSSNMATLATVYFLSSLACCKPLTAFLTVSRAALSAGSQSRKTIIHHPNGTTDWTPKVGNLSSP